MFNNLHFSLIKVSKFTSKHLVTLEDIVKSKCLAIVNKINNLRDSFFQNLFYMAFSF